jgi:hypothetical protein
MAENELATLVATITIKHVKGATLQTIYNSDELKEALSIQKHSADQLPFVDVGQLLKIDGSRYVVKSLSFRISEFSNETGRTIGANMYSESYSTACNTQIKVLVDNAD